MGAHDGAFEAEAEGDGDAVGEGGGEGGAEGGEVEFGEEAEGAEGEGEDGGDDVLEEPGGVEEGAVAAEGDADVEGVWVFGAELVCPVFEAAFAGGVVREEARGVEFLVVLECVFDVDDVRSFTVFAE